MGLSGWALADGAVPDIALAQNYLAISGLLICALAVASAAIAYLFKWEWKAKYYGAGFVSFASGSILGIYPILCIVIYGAWPLWARLGFLVLHFFLIVWWCRRFFLIYRDIFTDKKLRDSIYQEEEDAVYYLQQGDKIVIEKTLKFPQFPSNKFVIFFMVAAVLLAPYMRIVSNFVGVPFTQIFLAVSMTPVNLVFLGLATKMWLVFYHYPSKIKLETGKDVYVDMVSKMTKNARDE
jgi:hypothetical protein